MSTLLNLGSKVNVIHPIFTKELGLLIRPMDVGSQKIDRITLDTYRMVVVAFLVTNKAIQVKPFETTFLVANVSSEVVFRILFFIMSGVDVDF